MRQRYVWATCRCKCNHVFRDLVPIYNELGRLIARRKRITHECDTCLSARAGQAALAQYLCWRDSVAPKEGE